MGRPLASSSTSLSIIRTDFVRGLSSSSIRYPQMLPVMSEALAWSSAAWNKSAKVDFALRWASNSSLDNPVSQVYTSRSSASVRPFFSTFVT